MSFAFEFRSQVFCWYKPMKHFWCQKSSGLNPLAYHREKYSKAPFWMWDCEECIKGLPFWELDLGEMSYGYRKYIDFFTRKWAPRTEEQCMPEFHCMGPLWHPPTLRTFKYSYGNMAYLNAICHSLGESEGLFELHRVQIGEWIFQAYYIYFRMC